MLSMCLAAAVTLTPADVVIKNARIWTPGVQGIASFAAIRGGRFIYVGSRDSSYVGSKTQIVDGGGCVVIPGLIDSHVHMMGGGLGLSQLNLRTARDRDEFIRMIEEYAKKVGPGKWVTGGRWSTESWSETMQPTKAWIDMVTPNNPVILERMDGHSALVNSVALRMAGITKDGPADPPGGVIDRDPTTGEPTGILRESATNLVDRLVPPPNAKERMRALRLAMAEANRYGITAVSDIPSLYDLPVYSDLARSGDMSVRFFLYPTAGNWASAIQGRGSWPKKDDWMRVNGFKAYLDGSLGSRTAKMREPFLGNPPGKEDWSGLWSDGVENGQIAANVKAAAGAKLQTIAHAIGDEANHKLLSMLSDGYPRLSSARCRSEHAQHLLPDDIAQFGKLGVIASMQPLHKADDGRYAESYIGDERCKSSYAFRSLLQAGVVVAFGSDWPVVSIDPMQGVKAAVTGEVMDGGPWQIQENISVAQALTAYTASGAFAAFAEREIGRILPGYYADFVILSADPFKANVEWSKIVPTAVFVGGKRVYKRR